MRKRRFLGSLLMLALLLTLLAALGAGAYADGVSYLYYESEEAAIAQSPSNGTAANCTPVTASAAAVTWNSGWYAVNSDVTISGRITVSGDVHLILCDGATLTAQKGITVQTGNSLTIYAQSTGDSMGTLTAIGTGFNAGIGGVAPGGAGGTININGGTVNATGGQNGAGIGGAAGGAGGTITINGGTVKATGGQNGAGIGGGMEGADGNVTINGGTVNATGGRYGAGIGGGHSGAGGEVTISGGTVNATGGIYGAGIGGGGSEGAGGTVTISGGAVTATGGESGAGIGGGSEGAGGTVIITGGTVNATGGEDGGEGIGGGAGIGGGGSEGAGGTVTISGGAVTATGGQNGAGIGGGAYSSNAGTVILGDGFMVWAGGSVNPQDNNSNIVHNFESSHSQRYVYAEMHAPIITGADLVLSGSLDFRFYVALPKGDSSGAYMSFTIPGRNPETGTTGRSVKVNFADADNAADGQKIFPCPVYSIEMAESVTAVFHYKENGVDKTATLAAPVSVKDYLALADAQYPGNTELLALTNAARDYGHYMQLYLADLHGFTVGTNDETHTYDYQTMPSATEITALTALDGFETQWNNSSPDTSVLKAVGYYDTFNETTTLNILFRVADGTSGITATADGVARTVESVDEQGVAFGSNTYRIRIPDIAANNLDYAYHVQLSADGNTFCDMNVSALTYVSTMLANGSPTENEAKALTALYYYNVAADAYTTP